MSKRYISFANVSEYEKNGFKWASDQARARIADITNHLMDMGTIK